METYVVAQRLLLRSAKHEVLLKGRLLQSDCFPEDEALVGAPEDEADALMQILSLVLPRGVRIHLHDGPTASRSVLSGVIPLHIIHVVFFSVRALEIVFLSFCKGFLLLP